MGPLTCLTGLQHHCLAICALLEAGEGACEREVDFVSKRLRNYEFNPVWGFLTDQSWPR